jgi:hypothetical protein
MKAGFMPKHHEAAVSKASAWAEAVGYVANICLSLHKLEQLSLQEQQLLRKVQAHCRVSHTAAGTLSAGNQTLGWIELGIWFSEAC